MSDDDFGTVGENHVGRELETHTHAGVTHYVTGQHHAEIVTRNGRDFATDEPIQIARLTYVDIGGHACKVLVVRRDESQPWRARWKSRAGVAAIETSPSTAEGFELSERMLEALSECC